MDQIPDSRSEIRPYVENPPADYVLADYLPESEIYSNTSLDQFCKVIINGTAVNACVYRRTTENHKIQQTKGFWTFARAWFDGKNSVFWTAEFDAATLPNGICLKFPAEEYYRATGAQPELLPRLLFPNHVGMLARQTVAERISAEALPCECCQWLLSEIKLAARLEQIEFWPIDRPQIVRAEWMDLKRMLIIRDKAKLGVRFESRFNSRMIQRIPWTPATRYGVVTSENLVDLLSAWLEAHPTSHQINQPEIGQTYYVATNASRIYRYRCVSEVDLVTEEFKINDLQWSEDRGETFCDYMGDLWGVALPRYLTLEKAMENPVT